MQAHKIPFHRSEPAEQHDQNRGHSKGDAAEDDNDKIDEKKRRDGEETKRGSPMSLVSPIKGDPERAESANEKFGVLKNIVMHRYPDQFIGPRRHMCKNQDERHDQDDNRRHKKASDDPTATLRAAELRQQQRDHQELVKAAESGKASVPVDIPGPACQRRPGTKAGPVTRRPASAARA